jgi:hypothetical protein
MTRLVERSMRPLRAICPFAVSVQTLPRPSTIREAGGTDAPSGDAAAACASAGAGLNSSNDANNAPQNIVR